jgi:hypothetical protein
VRAFCGTRAPDLVITSAGPAFQFFKRLQQGLLAGVPALHGGVDERFFRGLTLSPLETAVSFRLEIPVMVGNILDVLPGRKEINFVFGASPIERFWSAQFRARRNRWEGRSGWTVSSSRASPSTRCCGARRRFRPVPPSSSA